MNVGKIYGFISEKLWFFRTLVSKKKFKNGKIYKYRFCDELFIDEYDKYIQMKENLKSVKSDYWNSQSDYSLASYFNKRNEKAEIMIVESFLPRFNTKPVLMDLGCGAGHLSARLSSKVKEIDGYEYSKALYETAKLYEAEIKNAKFYQGDARYIEFERKYDGVLIQGMLMYMENEDDIYSVLKHVYECLNPGGYLCTRDTLNCEGKDVIYLVNLKNSYSAVYWSQEVYYKQFLKAGFTLVDEFLLDDLNSRRLHFIARGAIWKKA